MPLRVLTHPDCVRHDPGPDHPEKPARLTVVLDRLRQLASADVREATAATLEQVAVLHPRAYLEQLRDLSERGGGPVSLDTVTSRLTWPAVLGAVGAMREAVAHAHEGRGHAFAAVRPPGHHALRATSMGFCFAATVVLGARHAQALGRERVLIVDWDVHHGNGTQALVERDASIRFVSLHQYPWYPGTGAAGERGVGNVFNVPRPPELPPGTYVADLWAAIVAATDGWSPDLILLSAGYDAILGDPLGGFTLEPEHYTTWTHRLRERFPSVPIVGLLEGGYVPARIAEGVAATVLALA